MSAATPLPAELHPVIDAHCHLERGYYGEGLGEVLARGRAAKLRGFVAVGASSVAQGSFEAIALAEQHADIVAAVGIHPHDAEKAVDADVDIIAKHMQHPRVRALGEVGLDYYYEHAPKAAQQRLFERFIVMAHETHQPLMLHIRDAHEDCWAMFDRLGVPERGVMVHCFTAGPREAEAYLTRGMVLSIPGVVTFKNAQGLREALKSIPAERLLVETDSPYLAPVPRRGQQNEPAFVQHTLAHVAEVRGEDPAVLAARVLETTRRFFRLDAD